MSTTICDGNILDFTSYFTALEKAYPANLWQKDPAVIDFKTLRETNAVSQSFLLKHRGSLQSLAFIKAIPEGPFQILQLLL